MLNRRELLKRIYDTAHEDHSLAKFLEPDAIAFRHRFQDGRNLCFGLFDYLPLSVDRQPDMHEGIAHRVVFDFKEGINPYICADLLAAAAVDDPLFGFGPDAVLVPVPASTTEKHEKRFKVFCRALAENLGITDGFPMLEVVKVRNKEDKRHPVRLIDSIRLNAPDDILKDRDVLVVDDVYTQGRSFETISDLMYSAGAKSVTGLFLARTSTVKDI